MKWNKIGRLAVISFFSLILLGRNGEAAETAAPISLEQCVDMALQQNLTVQMAKDDADKALASVKTAKGATGLTINAANTDYWKKTTSSTHPNNSPSAPFSLVTNQITMSLPIYNGGKMEKSVDAAVLGYANAQENQKISDAQIKYQTTVDYYKVLQYKNLLAADKRSVDDYTLHLKNLQGSFAAGLASKLQLLQTKVSLANAEDAMLKDQASYTNALVALKNMIGMDKTAGLELQENDAYVVETAGFDDCLQTALQNRPEQVVVKNAVKIAEDNLGIAYSGKRPTVTLNGTDGLQGSSLSNSDKNYFSVYVTIAYNLFDSGVTEGQVEEAKADLAKAQKAQKQQEDAIYADVNQYYWGMKEAEKRIEASKVAVGQADEVGKIANVSFSAGLETNQDILDAEVALMTAQNNYAQALYDYNTNKAGLAMAMGVAARPAADKAVVKP